MGYTHYHTHTKVTIPVWTKILRDCQELYEQRPEHLLIARGDGENLKGKKVGSRDNIIFNGYKKEAHETFCLYRTGSGGFFEFCKTAQKPYDLLVCACLIVYTYHSRSTMDLGSDGGWEDWAEALEFVERVLGAEYVMKFRLEQEFR